MECLALDFDGVISESGREVFVVGLRAFASMHPSSPVVGEARDLVSDRPVVAYDFAANALYRAFETLVPLGNRAEDFGVSLLLLEAGHAVDDQNGYDEFFSRQDPSWLAEYHRRFYGARARLRAASVDDWMALQQPYPRFVELLRRRHGSALYAIATAKDRRSVDLLVEHYGVADLFPPPMVFDKETGVTKTSHLRALSERIDVALEDVTFVDDKVNHLLNVADLGVRPVLAGWGYNTPREHALARSAGFEVATLEDADKVLFTTKEPDDDQ